MSTVHDEVKFAIAKSHRSVINAVLNIIEHGEMLYGHRGLSAFVMHGANRADQDGLEERIKRIRDTYRQRREEQSA